MEIEGNNPSCFKPGELIQSVYDSSTYRIHRFVGGMVELFNYDTERIEEWNDNNPHFIKIDNQLKLQL